MKVVQPATLWDVISVLDRLSHITQSELDATGLTKWNALKMLRELLDLSEAETVRDNDEPLFVLGTHPHPTDERVRMTWFIASDAFFNHGVSSTLYGRRFMRRLRARHPGVTFESVSWSTHPYVRRWFMLLGFVPVEGTLGTFRYG